MGDVDGFQSAAASTTIQKPSKHLQMDDENGFNSRDPASNIPMAESRASNIPMAESRASNIPAASYGSCNVFKSQMTQPSPIKGEHHSVETHQATSNSVEW
ncbi:hypothetical protein ACLOJK_007084 [Asimina triloba]